MRALHIYFNPFYYWLNEEDQEVTLSGIMSFRNTIRSYRRGFPYQKGLYTLPPTATVISAISKRVGTFEVCWSCGFAESKEEINTIAQSVITK